MLFSATSLPPQFSQLFIAWIHVEVFEIGPRTQQHRGFSGFHDFCTTTIADELVCMDYDRSLKPLLYVYAENK